MPESIQTHRDIPISSASCRALAKRDTWRHHLKEKYCIADKNI